MEKQYGKVSDLVNQLKQNYTETTYLHIFAIVTDEDWCELELLVDDQMSKRGDLFDDLDDSDDGTTSEEWAEIYGIETQE